MTSAVEKKGPHPPLKMVAKHVQIKDRGREGKRKRKCPPLVEPFIFYSEDFSPIYHENDNALVL